MSSREPTPSRPVVTLGGRGSDPMVGVIIGDRYRLVERIGSGGMGVVFRGEEVQGGRVVAIKLLHAQLGRMPEVVARFEREVHSASRLHHPNIIEVLDSGRMQTGALYLVMELLGGESLGHLIRRQGRLPPWRASAILRQVLAALSHAHAQRVIHRDLKPENIILGDNDFVKLVDFGIAKIADDQLPALTAAGVVCGTPEYMAPEQATSPDIDGRVDVYASGVILYEMLTGQRPFSGRNATDVMLLQMQKPPRSPRELVPEIPQRLEAAVLRAMAKSRDARFATAADMAAALDGPPKVAHVPLGRRILNSRTAQWLAIAVAGMAAVAAVIALALALRTKPAPAPAVDYLQKYEAAQTCAERRQALLELRDRGDRRALDALRKLDSKKGFARVRECMTKQEIDDAIRVLEASGR